MIDSKVKAYCDANQANHLDELKALMKKGVGRKR